MTMLSRYYELHPVYRLTIRWAFIAVATLVAFHASLLSVVETTRAAGMLGYVWTVPVAGVLAAIGTARRNRTELPIHDRQTDIIVGGMGMGLALLLQGVLIGRYAQYFHLLRLDLVALWMFVCSSTVLMFGLRPVIRFAWVWVLLLAVFPLPYFITVIAFGGNRVAAGAGTVVIAGLAAAVATGRHVNRGLFGAAGAWLVGLGILVIITVLFRRAPLLVFQTVPALLSICIVGVGMFLHARRGGAPKRVLDRKVEPLAVKQVWLAVPVVVIVAVVLAQFRLPVVSYAPTVRVDGLSFARPLGAPPGWHVVETKHYPWISRLHGTRAQLVRQKMVADVGDARFDKFARPRTLVVDATVTGRPFSLEVFPARVLYRIDGIRVSDLRPVDLGYGVSGDIISVVDDTILVTWQALMWTWTNGEWAERVVVLSVDNHEDNAPFPTPTGGLLPSVNSMFTILFRGNAATTDLAPAVKDDVLLVEFGRAMVRMQLEPLGIKP